MVAAALAGHLVPVGTGHRFWPSTATVCSPAIARRLVPGDAGSFVDAADRTATVLVLQSLERAGS